MHIVSGELRKATFTKQLENSMLFIVELSELIKDYKTGEKTYTNYSAALFAKTQAHADYYNSVLVEGNFIVLNCEKLKVKVSDCGKYTTLDMDNARLEAAKYIEPQQQGQQQQAPAQGGFQQQQQAPQSGGFSQQAPRDSGGFTKAQGGFPQSQQQQAPQQGVYIDDGKPAF
jgi:hypothetical protein